ncbi:unnamed protein product [Macrosiphum euphorbiae]|uniref:SWIM-type domain-containing protein n=2 Tax=Macrosiphum euphorbiae TaxID=13131 RepID=A0AAV0WVX5_9HEMI|nr:unnamed protein product [Macrosiphum euphorbiae]
MTSNSIIKLSCIINFIDDKKIFSKGENSFECGYVKSFNYIPDVGILSGQVHASMKNKLYDVKIFFKDKNIEHASCTCPTGLTKCHHMVSLLLHGHNNISVTDISCSWSKKSVRENDEVLTIDDMYENNFKAVTDTHNIDFKALCFDKLTATNQTVGFSWFLSPEPPVEDLSDILLLENVLNSSEFRNSKNSVQMLSDICKLSFEQVKDIASKTIGQSANVKWCLSRKFRLTSSNFHKIIKSVKSNRYPNSLFKGLLGKYFVDGVKSIEWGKTHESIAIEEFEKANNSIVTKTGIWLHESGFLGASPDGLLFDENSSYCIEVKCPYKFRNEDLKIALSNSKDYIINFDLNKNDFVLNSNHEYYDQIQGQMHMTKMSSAILIIWTTKSLVAFKMYKDPNWSSNIDILLHFYHHKFIPYILTDNSFL